MLNSHTHTHTPNLSEDECVELFFFFTKKKTFRFWNLSSNSIYKLVWCRCVYFTTFNITYHAKRCRTMQSNKKTMTTLSPLIFLIFGLIFIFLLFFRKFVVVRIDKLKKINEERGNSIRALNQFNFFFSSSVFFLLSMI